MKTNILFLIIDSFRNDKFFGNDRTCKTPNIDNLVKNGTYFQQAVSTSDATILNWTSIFSGLIPPKTGINYKPGIWHFPLISTEDTNFLVIDRKGKGENLIIHKFEKEKIILSY